LSSATTSCWISTPGRPGPAGDPSQGRGAAGASEEAYGEGITGLVQLAGPAAGLTRLARVGLENLAETDRRAHIALQWEAIAADGKLFAALDADLMLVPAGDQTTALALAGAAAMLAVPRCQRSPRSAR